MTSDLADWKAAAQAPRGWEMTRVRVKGHVTMLLRWLAYVDGPVGQLEAIAGTDCEMRTH